MTRPFIHEDFLLETEQARQLYHGYAENLPVIDYHCHLPPDQIAGDKRFRNMAEIWLGGDHYKWRAMRSDGVAELYCTGRAPDWEKFEKWAATVPHLLGNPLYHWAALELARFFDVYDLLSPATAKEIWIACNERLADPAFSARGLMKRSNVVLVCTTDDPADSLEHHGALAADPAFNVQVLPTWRPDKGMAVEKHETFNAWVDRLASAAGVHVRDFGTYLQALRARHDFFAQMGCRLSDHGLETIYAEEYTRGEIEAVFLKVRGGKGLDSAEIGQFKSAMLHEFAVMDHEKGWTQQFHLGVLRNNNTRMFNTAGPDTGFDSIGDFEIARPLAKFLDRLDQTNQLAKTILYNINPRDTMPLAAMLGNFQDGSVPAKMQLGSGWWFLDQKDYMEMQLRDLAAAGVLARFVGMATDSRSFLSYPRHEYFRRVLCNFLGTQMAKGFIPGDMDLVGRMVRDISCNNAAAYFGFDVPRLSGL